MKTPFLALIIGLTLFSCGQHKEQEENLMDQPVEKKPSAREQIEAYVKKNNLKGEFTPSGLYVVIEKPGTGNGFPNATSTVKAEYSGYFLNGEVFDASKPGQPIEFPLNQVIPGWTEGLQKLKKGGKAKLIIPAELGYGERGAGPIPPGSILAFDVTLVDWK
jgi:FKBP-type peptidyl-prolyl cis-trans isomerase